MTPAARLSTALRTLHWTATTTAREAGVSVRLVQYWLEGRYEPSADVLGWLEELAALIEAHPRPRG